LNATRAAVEEGIVTGGGVALVRCLPALEKLELEGDENRGIDILKKAMTEPLIQIANNAGTEGAVVLSRVLGETGAFGFNAQTLAFEDLEKAGVIDPAKVVRVSLQNAASIAGFMLTTAAVIVGK
jgi:chaperonin GroEL